MRFYDSNKYFFKTSNSMKSLEMQSLFLQINSIFSTKNESLKEYVIVP